MIPKDAALVTLDVQSLYPSIPNNEGLAAVRNFMNKFPDPKRPDTIILNLLEICLTKNSFEFDGKIYIQKSGAAMGHSYCVHYSNMFMADWEIKAILSFDLKPLVWFRFIDDIFCVWTFDKLQFKIFLNHLNAVSPSIKLTFEYDLQSIDFLDVTIYKGARFELESFLDTRVFFKKTDKHQLLHKSSHHPKHIFKSIVKSQVLRFSRISNNMADFENSTTILFQSLYKRGYSKRFLRGIKHDIKSHRIDNVDSIPQTGSSPCNSTKCKKCPYVSKCNEMNINGKPFWIRSNLTCDSANVIYVISCLRCNIHYIGQTMNPLRTRLGQHLSDIRLEKPTSIAEHFINHAENIIDIFRMTPIFYVQDMERRKSLEMKFIKHFGTLSPIGLNDRFDPYNKNDSLIPLILPFSNSSHFFAKGIRDLTEKHSLDIGRFITAYSRSKNLSNLLNNKL